MACYMYMYIHVSNCCFAGLNFDPTPLLHCLHCLTFIVVTHTHTHTHTRTLTHPHTYLTTHTHTHTYSQSVLPAASLEVVSSAVDLLSSRQWPQRCVWHVVNSMATSQCLHSISQHQLARYTCIVQACTCTCSICT